jgi:hypothetical protein
LESQTASGPAFHQTVGGVQGCYQRDCPWGLIMHHPWLDAHRCSIEFKHKRHLDGLHGFAYLWRRVMRVAKQGWCQGDSGQVPVHQRRRWASGPHGVRPSMRLGGWARRRGQEGGAYVGHGGVECLLLEHRKGMMRVLRRESVAIGASLQSGLLFYGCNFDGGYDFGRNPSRSLRSAHFLLSIAHFSNVSSFLGFSRATRELPIPPCYVHSVAQITIWIEFVYISPCLVLISCKEVITPLTSSLAAKVRTPGSCQNILM